MRGGFGPNGGQAAQKGLRPQPHIVRGDLFVHGEHALGHGGGGIGKRAHGIEQGAFDGFDIKSIAQVGLIQLRGGAGEFGEHQGTRTVIVAGHELLSHEVHAVLKGGD